MSFCRRCARTLADHGLDDEAEGEFALDLREVADDTIVAVWTTAFDIAEAHESEIVGVEHLIAAMTEVASAAAFLHARGFDLERLKREARRVVIETGGDGPVTQFDLAPEIDLETTLELAVMSAEDDGRERAGLDDLVEVLVHYTPEESAVVRLVDVLKQARVGSKAKAPMRAALIQPAAPQPLVSGSRQTVSRQTVVGSQTVAGQTFAGHDAPSVREARTASQARSPSALPGLDHLFSPRSGGRPFEAGIALDKSRAMAGQRAAYAGLVSGAATQPAANDVRDPFAARLEAVERRMLDLEARFERMRPQADSGRRVEQSTTRTAEDGIVAALAGLTAAIERQHDEMARLAERIERLVTAAAPSPAPGPASASASSASRSRDSSERRYGSRAVRTRRKRAMRRRREPMSVGALRLASLSQGLLRRMPSRRERRAWAHHGVRDKRRGDYGRGRPAREKRFYLALDHDIAHAPSIGPRTAERLRAAGVVKVRDLMTADLAGVAASVPVRYVTEVALRDWRDQARLVCTVPFLRGTHAQLLVGAGYRSPEAVAAADPVELMSAILRFATTREGQSVLRSGPPPDSDKVKGWMLNAAEAEPARAA
ncbi:MAG: DUF4332 domain-containing protein [Hyphomicrobiaceae bacterium]